MSKFAGRQVKVGVGVEATRGAGVAPTYRVPHASLSFDDKIEKARAEVGLGNLADSEEAFVTNKFAQGELEGEVRMDSIGVFLYALLGTVATTGPSDSAYTHAFTIDHDVASKSLALAVQDGNETEMYKMCMIDTLEIVAELDQTVMFTVGIISKQATDSGATLPTLTDEVKMIKKNVKIKVADTIGNLGAASVLSIKRLRLSFAKGAVLDDALGTAEPEDVVGTQIAVEGELELNYEDQTWKDYFKDGTYRAMEIFFDNADEQAGGGSTNYSLKIQLPKVDFFEWEPNYALGEVVKQTLSFKANHDADNDQEIVHLCQLVNAVTSY